MTIHAAFSGFSVDSIETAKAFYGDILGCAYEDQMMGGMRLILPGEDTKVWVYEKPHHVPAAFTILNFVVDDIDKAVDSLTEQGVVFEHYPDMYQDDKGIARGKDHNRGPNIAWFKDPAGNILSILED
jgi:catechol 2,3-dioxygenase-like lactoylglutathione lyase family enzyme